MRTGAKTTEVLENIISDLVSLSWMIDFARDSRTEGSAWKAKKNCQNLLFDVHVVHRTPEMSFPGHISEEDGEQMASSYIPTSNFCVQ